MSLNDVPSSDVRVVSTMSASSGRWNWCTAERCVRAIASAEPRTELAATEPVTSYRPPPKRCRPSIPAAYAAASQVRRLARVERAVDGGDITPMALSPPRRSRVARASPYVVRGSIVVPPAVVRSVIAASTPSDVPPATRPVSLPAPRMRDAPGTSTPSGASPASCGARPMRRE